jgi:hypothetical protein
MFNELRNVKTLIGILCDKINCLNVEQYICHRLKVILNKNALSFNYYVIHAFKLFPNTEFTSVGSTDLRLTTLDVGHVGWQ